MVLSISIPAFREEGDLQTYKCFIPLLISIPAFREEGDPLCCFSGRHPGYFNPRLP